ncbi:ABC transporter permease [Acidimangrovimonas sediminis]|uniref:ABC transporter permease n=1 Tax=Acidimangrovimonas sediminis TaxID=2056283 RepID=UPI000C7FA30A|nr:ABC transporter permease [Acidimangrovimonas sediminis]
MTRLSRIAGPLLVPVLAWICYIFLMAPSLVVIPISFGGGGDLHFPPKTWSLELYREFFTQPAWWGTLLRSLVIALCVTVMTTLLVVPAAYALQRARMPGGRILTALAMGPLLVPVIVLALGLYLELAPFGMLNHTLTVVLAHTMLATPFMMTSVGASLRHLDRSYEQVSLIMGASKVRIFFRVVLPQLKSGIAAGALFAFLISLDEVIVAYFITGPDTETLPVKMYSALRWEISPIIAAVSTLLTLVSLLLAVAMMRLERKERSQ